MRRTEVTVLAQLRLFPEYIEQGTRDLNEFARVVCANESDCLGIEIVQDLDDPTRITMIERWASRAAYEGPHLQTEHMKAFIAESSRYFDGAASISLGHANVIEQDSYRRRAPYGR